MPRPAYQPCPHGNAAAISGAWRTCRMLDRTVTPGVCALCTRRGKTIIEHGPDKAVYPARPKPGTVPGHAPGAPITANPCTNCGGLS